MTVGETSWEVHPCAQPRTILVVEDDETIRESLAEILRDEGYAVETAANGREAIALLGAHRPCMMLLDLMMPVMSGWEVARRMAQDESLRAVPFCVVSAVADPRKVPAAAACVIEKPVDLEALLDVVHKYCGGT